MLLPARDNLLTGHPREQRLQRYYAEIPNCVAAHSARGIPSPWKRLAAKS